MTFNTVGLQGSSKEKLHFKPASGFNNFSQPAITYKKHLNCDVFQKSAFVSPFPSSKNPLSGMLSNVVTGFNKVFKPAFTGKEVINNTLANDQAFKNFRKNLIDSLTSELESASSKEIIPAISVLGKLQAEKALPLMIDMLHDKNTSKSVYCEIVRSLSNFRSNDALIELCDVLNDTNKENTLRSEAALSLSKFNNRRASKPLYDVLSNVEDNSKVRAASAEALASYPSIRTNSLLLDSLKDASPEVRASSAKALGILKSSEAIDTLIELLADKSYAVNTESAIALGELKVDKALPNLIKLLKKDNFEIVNAVCRALKSIDKNCSKELVTLLNDKNESLVTRSNALTALNQLNYKEAENTIISIAQNNTEDKDLKDLALSTLTKFKSANARQLFEDVLKDNAESMESKTIAAEGLTFVANQTSVNVLADLLKTSIKPEFRKVVLNTIDKVFDNNSSGLKIDLNVLLQELNSSDANNKEIVINIIGRARAKEAASTLIDVIQYETNPNLRALAAKSLYKLESKEAIQPLTDMLLNDQVGFVKVQAALSLYQLGEKASLYNLIKNEEISEDVKKAAVLAMVALGEKSDLFDRYMKPALSVPQIHQAGITGKDVQVAVVDKPIDPTHPEFEDRVIIKPLEHGTLVAGNVGGKLTGVAPKSTLLSYNAFNDKNIGVSDIVEKIVDEKLAGKNNVKVINLSLGFDSKLHNDWEVKNELKQWSKAVNLANKVGITVVIAAGNGGLNPEVKENNIGTMNLLGLHEIPIVVGAVDTKSTPDDMSDDVRAEFSSYPMPESKRQIDIMAPGQHITLPYPGGGYKPVDGTSFATPFISGLVALMYEANPNITPAQVKEILNKTAVKLKAVPDHKQGSGEVNPYQVIYEAMALESKENAEEFKKNFNKNLTQVENKKAA